MDKTIGGLILAGGENSRFEGLPKGSMKWDGQSLFDRVYKALQTVVDEAHISIHDKRPAGLPEEIPAVVDEYPDVRGPMNGVFSALKKLNTPLLIVPWDMPGINAMFLKQLIEQWQALDSKAYYVTQGDQPQPFPGIYTPRGLGSLRDSLESGQRSMLHWLESIRAPAFDVDQHVDARSTDSLFMNINDPENIQQLIRHL